MNISQAKEVARTHSVYLAESFELFPDLTNQIDLDDIGERLASLHRSIPDQIGTMDEEMSKLRRLKRQSHLLIALADISGRWDWGKVTHHLTQLADFTLHRILSVSAKAQNIEGDKDNPAPGLFILAMGKYGAFELNYSSDIDFNVFYDPDLIKVPNPARAERTLIKIVQGIIKGMESITADGYIFRTDLRLRPDPRSNAVAVSTLTAERYYETLGQNWERAAMIKARVCAGDKAAGNAFIQDVLKPFIWRKNLDYEALEDIMAIKRQIDARGGAQELNISGHNLKLGLGGIREIEFYAQVQQLILGGRNPELRSPRTVDALEALASGQFMDGASAERLKQNYSLLRKLEHVAQMMKDEQTHLVPQDETNQLHFARLAGFDSYDSLQNVLKPVLLSTREIYAELYPDASPLSSSKGNLVFTGVEPGPGTLEALKSLGFSEPEIVWHDMAAWLGGRIKATRTQKAREILTSIAPNILESCSATTKPNTAFKAFAGFIERLKSGISIFSMFKQNPEHLTYVISLMVRSQRIADWVAERPEILDALSDPQFLEVSETEILKGKENVTSCVSREDAMNAARRWVKEEKFRISAGLLSGKIKAIRASRLFSILAEQAIISLLPFAIKDVENKTGKIRGGIAVLGMGKLASSELNLGSDLDIVVVYEPDETEITNQHFYARITQRLVSALSALTEEGGMYEVDMALRPLGKSGPVAVSLEAYLKYYEESAWSWEFMALCRSKVICANSTEFREKVESFRLQVLNSDRPDLNFEDDIADMLRRTRREKKVTGDWDLKNIEGGIRDLEFVAQKAALKEIRKGIEVGLSPITQLAYLSPDFSDGVVEVLKNIYQEYLDFNLHLSVRHKGGKGDVDPKALKDIAEAMNKQSVQHLIDTFKGNQKKVKSIVDSYVL